MAADWCQQIGLEFFLVNDIHTPPSSQKEEFLFFWSKMTRSVMKWIKDKFPNLRFFFIDIIVKNLIFLIHLAEKKEALSSETYFWVLELFFVRCLVFEKWSILYFTFVMQPGLARIQIFLW